ncbi:MAG: hypothetical protein JWN62_1165, partial [Acidimicrobiales bacterium]|nr:hypothetical protein [Acidimicrobiales bacterium]
VMSRSHHAAMTQLPNSLIQPSSSSTSGPAGSSAPSPSRPFVQAPIVRSLSIEWQHRTVCAADLRRARAWQLPGAAVTSLDDMLDRCGFTPTPEAGGARRELPRDPQADGAHDAYLLDLLRVARTDELAARIVLQRILPALCGTARRHAPERQSFHALLDELVSNAWPVIRTYPVDRRPRRVVANLVRDIGFQTFVRPTRLRYASEVPVTHEDLGDQESSAATHPLTELLELLGQAQQARVISATDVELIIELVRLGRPERVAAARQVTPRTVRNHRDVILYRLRAMHAAEAGDMAA